MYLLKNLGIVHNTIFHILCCFFLIVQIACAAVLLSLPVSYANEHGATVLTVPVTTDDFPNCQKNLETLLHHATGIKEPRIYKYKAPKGCKSAMQLTPSWLKTHDGTLPLFSVREESATQVQLSQYTLSQAIQLIKSSKCKNDVSFVSVLDKKIANTLKTCNQLSSLPFQGTRKSSINLLEHVPFLCPLNYEKNKVPITLSISFNLWKKMFKHRETAKKTKRKLSYMHKKLQSTFDKIALTLPTHITFLEVSNKHHVEPLHQNMIHVSSIIVQTHGKQKVILMPPISEQHPYHCWLNLTGQFFLNKKIDLSASNNVLNNESRLAHTTLYSVNLNPGDMLLVPANWFIYRKSISTSVSLSLNYLSGDQWRLFCFQTESMEQAHDKYFIQKKRAVTTWAHMEIKQHPYNTYNIICACESIQQVISDAKQQVLDLHNLNLTSLPDAIFWIPHLKKLHVAHNHLTSFSLNHIKNLVSLDLECNQLTSFSLSHMPNLVSLNLACNHLTSFSLSHVQNLVSLNLECNDLTSFSLSHMKNIASLDLFGNKLNRFLSCDLPSATHIDLSYNNLSCLSQHCMSSINTNQFIKLYLQNNPLSNEGITQIQKDLLQRPGGDVTDYPIWFSLIEHITHNAIKYEDFFNLLSCHNMFPSSEIDCLTCPITHETPHKVIFFVNRNKYYIIYDADALIQWIQTYPDTITDPSTREPLTLTKLISVKEPHVSKYLQQKLGSVSTKLH